MPHVSRRDARVRVDRAVWEREMNRLRVGTRVLAAASSVSWAQG